MALTFVSIDPTHERCRQDIALICSNLRLDGVEQRVFGYILLDPKASTYPCVCVTLEGLAEEEGESDFEFNHIIYPVDVYLIDRASTDYQPTSKNWLRWRHTLAREFRRRYSLPNTPEVYDIRIAPRTIVDPRLVDYQLILSAFTVRCYAAEPAGRDAWDANFPTPDAPILTATAVSGAVSLKWTPPYGFNLSFAVYRSLTPGGEDLTTPLIANLPLASYDDFNVTDGTTYYYMVAAFDPNGQGSNSNEVSATPGTPAAPPPPASLTATPGVGQVALSWPMVPFASAYNVYRANVSGGEAPPPLAVGVRTTTYTDDGGLPSTATFYYAVTSLGTVGQESSTFSPEASAMPLGPPPVPPLAPTNLAAVPGDGQVVLTWTASAGAVSYNVYRGTDPLSLTLLPAGTAVPSVTFTDTTAVNDTLYYYEVTAMNSAGESPASEQVSATPTAALPTIKGLLATTDPGAPRTDPKILSNPYLDGILLRMNWDFMEPSEGDFTQGFAYVDDVLTKAANAAQPKWVALRVAAGIRTPAWVYAAGANQVVYSGGTIPPPYDSVYLSKFKAFITAFGARYASNPTVRRVVISGVNSDTEETFLPTSNPVWQSAGYTQTLLENAYQSIAHKWAGAFPNQHLALMVIAGQSFPNLDPNGKVQSGAGTQTLADIISWSIAHLGGNRRFCLQNNGLSSQWYSTLVKNYAAQCTIGYQMVAAATAWSHTPKWRANAGVPYCGSPSCTPTDPQIATVLQNALNNGIGGQAIYLEVVGSDVYTGSMATPGQPIPAIVGVGGVLQNVQGILG